MGGQKSHGDLAQESRSPDHSEHGNVAFQGACQRREDVRRAGLSLFADSAEEGVHARLSLSLSLYFSLSLSLSMSLSLSSSLQRWD